MITRGGLVVCCGASIAHGQPMVTESAKWLPESPEAGQAFGASVAMDGGIAVVGSPGRSSQAGVRSGRAFMIDMLTGAEIRSFEPSYQEELQRFGDAVAVGGGYVLVGARLEEGADLSLNAGAAYVFDAETGVELHKFTPDRGLIQPSMGSAVALRGTIALIGAPGESDPVPGVSQFGKVYVVDVSTGQRLWRLALPPTDFVGAALGASVAFAGDLAVAGAPDDLGSGAVHLFDLTTGGLVGTITPGDTTQRFGTSIAVSGSTLIVGAPDDDELGTNAGAAYLFDLVTGSQLAKLTPPSGSAHDRFGESVAIEGDMAVVGTPGNIAFSFGEPGAVHVYGVASGDHLATLVASDGASGDVLGFAVAVAEGTVLAGARLDVIPGAILTGSVYRFGPCNADVTGDFTVNMDDLDTFVAGFLGGELARADCDANGALNVDDVECFVSAFGDGCP